MRLRAEAHTRKGSALSQLAMHYQARAGDLRARLKGDELVAALAALFSEQQTAERALSAQLAAEARQLQRGVLREMQLRRAKRRQQLAEEARAAAKPLPRRQRRRPRQRRNPGPKGNRPHR